MKKGIRLVNRMPFDFIGRCERIRTFDPLHPM